MDDGGAEQLDGAPSLDEDAAMDPDAAIDDAGETSDASDGSDAGEAVSLRELCNVLAAAVRGELCDGDADACEAMLEPAVARCEALIEAVDRGRFTFDGAAAAACVEGQTQDQLANAFAGLYFQCPDAFIGQIEVSEDCYFDYRFVTDDCERGAYCDQAGACPGECRAYQPIGARCPTDGQCDPELVCLRDCEPPCEGTCGPPPGVGDDCEASGRRCATGLICDSATEPASCAAQRAPGEPCTYAYQCESFSCIEEECVAIEDLECRSELDCDDELCEEGRCVPRRSEGAACSTSEECAQGLECLYDTNEGAMFCRDRAAIDGESCVPWGCEADHYCANEDGVLICRPDRGTGESCEDHDPNYLADNAPCEEGLRCMISNTFTCLPPGGLDEPCYYNDTGSCEDGLVCLGWALSTCQPPSELDEPCNAAFENACVEGYCTCEIVDDSCPTDWFCVEQLEDGEPCEASSACASGYCDTAVAEPVCGQDPGEPLACLPD